MSNNGIPPVNDWQADNYPVIYDEGLDALQYVKTGAKTTINTGGSSYLVYAALLSQSGTDAPVAYSILQNTLGAPVVLSYDSVGNFIATCAGAFTSNKTVVFFASQNRAYQFVGYQNDIDTVYFNTSVTLTGAFANGCLDGTGIEIRVHP